jgi:hypothetical protein
LFANLLAAVNAHPYVPNSSDKLKALFCYRRGRSARSRAGCRTGAWPWFRARLEQIINLRHELARLAGQIDWDFIDGEIAPLYSDKGRPGIPTRFAIGLLLLKQIYGLSDEGVCERWVYDPYFQYFTGEEFFQHEFPHERSDLSHWRSAWGTNWNCCWRRACGWRTRAGPCGAKTSSGSRSTPLCSPRTSASRRMPSCASSAIESVLQRLSTSGKPILRRGLNALCCDWLIRGCKRTLSPFHRGVVTTYTLELGSAGDGDNRDHTFSAFRAPRYSIHEILPITCN